MGDMSMRDGMFWFGFPDHIETYCEGCGCPDSSYQHGMDCPRYEDGVS